MQIRDDAVEGRRSTRRNGEEGFVTSVAATSSDHAFVRVSTPAPDGVSWTDLVAPEGGGKARERILDAAYDLFSKRCVRAVGTEVLARQGWRSRPSTGTSVPMKSLSWRSCSADTP